MMRKFYLSRWEDGLADGVEYDSSGKVKTKIIRSPFIQVLLPRDSMVGRLMPSILIPTQQFCRFRLGLLKIDS